MRLLLVALTSPRTTKKRLDQLFTKATFKRLRTNFRPSEIFDRPLGSQGRVHTEDAELNFMFLISFCRVFLFSNQ